MCKTVHLSSNGHKLIDAPILSELDSLSHYQVHGGFVCSECQLSNDRRPCTQIPVTLLLLPEGRTDARLHTLWCPIIFMQMKLKSGGNQGHPFLLVLISNKCNIVYIIHEDPFCVSIHCNLERKARLYSAAGYKGPIQCSSSSSCPLQYKVEVTFWGIPFLRVTV